MRSKLETSLAELHKIKNQIRAELNQVRPRTGPIFTEKRDHSAKRIFTNRYAPTDIVNPSPEKSQLEASKGHKKRYFDSQNILFTDTSRSTEKKHYGRHYADSVSLEIKVRKSHSPYFSIRPAPPPVSPSKHENTSLLGIGLQDKSFH